MTRIPLMLCLLGVALSSLADEAPQALVGATVIDGRGGAPLADGVILVSGGKIACIGNRSHCPVPPGAVVHELQGQFITPGLVDAHVHFSQTGWLDGRPDGLSAPEIYPYGDTSRNNRENPGRWHRAYLCSGITAVFDVGGHPWTTGLPARSEANTDAVHVRATGPLVTHADVPALNLDEEHFTFLPMGSDAQALQSVERLAAMGASAVKVWYLAPEAKQRDILDARFMKVGQAARRAGLDLVVHATQLREAKIALRAGANMLVHSVDDALVDDEFLELMQGNNAIYSPTLLAGVNWGYALASVALDTPFEIDDPNNCVDPDLRQKIAATSILQPLLPQRRRSTQSVYARMQRAGAEGWVMAENLRRVQAAGLTIATATDAGNPLTLHGPSIYAELEAMQQAGLSPADIIVMATRNGALAMNRLDTIGTLEQGKLADLLVLEQDPMLDVRAFRSLSQVMRGGLLRRQGQLAVRPGSAR